MVTTGANGPSGPSACVRRPQAWACPASVCDRSSPRALGGLSFKWPLSFLLSLLHHDYLTSIRFHIHFRHASRLHETRSRGVMRRNRAQVRKSVSFATCVVERAILPGSAHQQMITKTWMKSEQSRPVMLTVICLVWIGAIDHQLSDRTERRNSWWKGVAGICRFWRS